MRRSSWLSIQRETEYKRLYGHLSIVIEGKNTTIQIPYTELFTCSKRRLNEILELAASYGGWKLIDHTKEKNYE